MQKCLAMAAAVAVVGCAMGGATKPWGTATVEPGAKWSKVFNNVGGDFEGRLTWDTGGPAVNVYWLSQAEWNRWNGGADADKVAFDGKAMGLSKGELTAHGKAHTSSVLVFENPGTAPVRVKWETSQR